MDIPTLEAVLRDERGSHAPRRLRRQGMVPAILYGRGEPNVVITVQRKAIEKLLHEHHFVMNLECEDLASPAQLKEVQYDALGEEVIHADFGRISLTEALHVTVPIELHGEPEGVKEGGVLEVILHEVSVECLPTNVPENIRVEVANLKVGDGLRVRDIPVSEGVSILAEPDAVVVVITAPPEVVEEEAEEAGMAEPEVIGKPEGEDEGAGEEA
jgi:large subunit ribosomal protein L25